MVCDLCAELAGSDYTAFSDIYGNGTSRIVAWSDHLVALPTLGQLFPGSLLILPKRHIEMLSLADAALRIELDSFVTHLWDSASAFGFPIVFEHGALSCTGASCGVYHAHLHLVPLPCQIDMTQLLPEAQKTGPSLGAALSELTGASQYIFVGDARGIHVARDEIVRKLPSQCIRRRLTEMFSIARSWDWRTYTVEEPWVRNAIEHYGSAKWS